MIVAALFGGTFPPLPLVVDSGVPSAILGPCVCLMDAALYRLGSEERGFFISRFANGSERAARRPEKGDVK